MAIFISAPADENGANHKEDLNNLGQYRAVEFFRTDKSDIFEYKASEIAFLVDKID